MRTPRLRALALAAALLLGLTACGGESGGTDDDSGAAGAGAKGSGRFPVTIEHALGTTVVPDRPKRVATVNRADDGVPLAFGVVPAGMDKTDFGDDDGDGVPPWTEDRLEEPGAGRPVLCDETDGIGFGAVADTGPDVIPASCSGPTEQDCETLGRIALLVPRAGRVVLDGKEVHRTPARELARALGPSPRSPVTPEGITVLDLVGRGHHPHQRAFSRWTAQDDAALEATRTTEPAERAVDELSGGRRQRVWIAMAPAQQTDLLLDGPTTFLDISHRIEVLDLPTDLNRTRGATIGMVPHDLDPAARYADRLMALASGRLHAAGTPEEVMTEDTVRAVYGMESRVIEDPVPGRPLLPPIGRHHSTATDAEAAAASSQHAAGSR